MKRSYFEKKYFKKTVQSFKAYKKNQKYWSSGVGFMRMKEKDFSMG